MPSSNSLLRVFRQTDDNTSFCGVTFQEASYQKQSLLQQHGKFKKMKSLSHMSPYLRPTSESLRIVVAQSCYEFVPSCRFISLYRQADSLFPIFLCTVLLEALTHTHTHTHTHYPMHICTVFFHCWEYKIQKAGVFFVLFFQSQNQRFSYYQQFIRPK